MRITDFTAKGVLTVAITLFLGSRVGWCGKPDNLDYLTLSLDELKQIEVVTADRMPESIANTSASIILILQDEIQQSGARTIFDLLQHIPGIIVGVGNFGENYVALRGVHTLYSEKVLFMLNGHVLNDARSGSATYQFLDHLPVKNIKQIEIVLGPGSALYGANAFSGVINILTRQAEQVAGIEADVNFERGSSGNIAGRYNVFYGQRSKNDWGTSLNINYVKKPGNELAVASDVLGRSGYAATQEQLSDVQAVLEKGEFQIQGRYMKRRAGDYFGALHVLNDQSNQEVEFAFLDMNYHAQLTSAVDITTSVYVNYQETANFYVGYPAGSIPPDNPYYAWNSDGLKGETLAKELLPGMEVRVDYTALEQHALTLGMAYRHERLYDVGFKANYNPNYLPDVEDVK